MNTLNDIETAIKGELQNHQNDATYCNEDKENDILIALKKHFNYDYASDAVKYFLKATIIEVWEHHLNITIPALRQG